MSWAIFSLSFIEVIKFVKVYRAKQDGVFKVFSAYLIFWLQELMVLINQS